MNKWKYYIKAGLMAFVVSPLICSIGCFIFFASLIFLSDHISRIRQHVEWIPYLTGVVPPIFILIFSWGRFFKKTSIPESWGQRIAPLMAAFIYYIGVWAVVFVIYQSSHSLRSWNLQFWLMPPYLVLNALLLLAEDFSFFPIMQLVSTVISLATLVFICRQKQLTAVIGKRLRLHVAAIIAIAAIIVLHAGCLYLDAKTSVVCDGIDLTHYQPFGKKIPRLSVESGLKLTHDLPVLDGALALYPVYSAFATAVYPKAAYPLHMNSGQAQYHRGSGRRGENPHPVHFTNTRWSFLELLNGHVDICFVTEFPDEHRETVKKRNIDLVLTPIGRDAVVFFVDTKNPVNSLSVQDIRGIYSGRITQWENLGGNGGIEAFQLNADSCSKGVLKHLMAGDVLLHSVQQVPIAEKFGSTGSLMSKGADDRSYTGAIGFSLRFFATRMAASNQVKILKINGVAPTEENVRNGSYPLISTLYAITRADTTHPNVQLMLDWMVSDQGQYLIREVGYVPIRTAAFPQHSPLPEIR